MTIRLVRSREPSETPSKVHAGRVMAGNHLKPICSILNRTRWHRLDDTVEVTCLRCLAMQARGSNRGE